MHIGKLAKEIAEQRGTRRCPDCFTQTECILLFHHRELRNEAFKRHSSHPTAQSHCFLKKQRGRQAKRSWQALLAYKCQHDQLKTNLRDTWEMVIKLVEGYQGHHHAFFKDSNGRTTSNDKDNAKT